jgi:nucleotide-binding universal stress UspA family protein
MSHVVVGVDSSAEAKQALHWAARYAKTAQLPLRVVTAVELPEVVGRAATLEELAGLDEHRAEAERWLQRIALGSSETKDVEVEFDVMTGHAVAALTEHSRSAAALVVGARGAGAIRRAVLGSVSSGVVHHAHCPVVVVRRSGSENNGRVVVGIDGSESSIDALNWAADYVRAVDGNLTLVSAWDWPTLWEVPVLVNGFDPRTETKEKVETAAQATGLLDGQLRTVVGKGEPARVILEEAEGADLVVVGSHGLGGFAGMLLGSVSDRVLHRATCPVVVVRPAHLRT